MAIVDVRCSRCGKVVQIDDASASQACPNCGSSVAAPAPRVRAAPTPQVAAAPRPQPRPAPQAVGAATVATVASADGEMTSLPIEEEEEPSSLQAAFAWLLPWALSITIHLAAFLLLMFFTFTVVKAGEDIEEDDPTAKEDIPLPIARQGDSDTPGSSMLSKFSGIEPGGMGKDKTDFSKPAMDLADQGNSGGAASDDAQLGIVSATGSGTAAGTGDGTGSGTAGLGNLYSGGGQGGGRGSKFFGTGLPRRGVSRIIYIVDKSGSMLKTFDFVKAELVRSVKALSPQQQFHVILFADGPATELVIDGTSKLRHATPKNKEVLEEWMNDKSPASTLGQTDPQVSMKKALALAGTSEPTLIYLLTDGLFPKDTQTLLQKTNTSKKVMVNTILFGEGDKPEVQAEKLLKDISKENGGIYKFIGESDLGREY